MDASRVSLSTVLAQLGELSERVRARITLDLLRVLDESTGDVGERRPESRLRIDLVTIGWQGDASFTNSAIDAAGVTDRSGAAVLAWEVFAGRPAPRGTPGRVHAVVDEIDPDVDDTIARALSGGFATVGELREALSEVLRERVADRQEVIDELGPTAPLPPTRTSPSSLPPAAELLERTARRASFPPPIDGAIAPLAPAPLPLPGPAPKAPRPTVLVIGAFASAEGHLAADLRAEGFDVVFAISAAAGFEAICDAPPACVICDLDLPDSDGDMVVRELRRLPRPIASTPFMLVASPAPTRVQMARFAAGADVCVLKPYADREIVAQVVALYRMTARLRDARSTLSRFPKATSRAFQGDLKHISLAAVLTVVDMERRTGVLHVSNETTDVALTIAGGYVTRGAIAGRPVTPLVAMGAMLDFQTGRFSFASNTPVEPLEDACRVSEVLTEATRLQDEEANRAAERAASSRADTERR